MRIIILGAGAGGGLPQWNCGCVHCNAARAGRLDAMSQSSLAVSADGETWAVLNASPDIRAQLAATRALHPSTLPGTDPAGWVSTDDVAAVIHHLTTPAGRAVNGAAVRVPGSGSRSSRKPRIAGR